MNDSARWRVMVVDDEPPARALMKEYLGAHPDLEVVAECANGFEAVKTAGELKPDLVFLDVQMPKLDGFEVLELLDPGPLVIFATAYDEFALKAFEVNAVDYLLKPFGRDRLAEALERARTRLRERAVTGGASGAGGPATASGGASPVDGDDDEPDDAPPPPSGGPPAPATSDIAFRLASAARPGRVLERILVRDGGQVTVIPVEAVDYLEAQDDYIAIHALGKSHLKSQRLAELAAALDADRFVRVHRSYVLNIERIASIDTYAKDSRIAVLKDGRRIPVSRSGYQRLRSLM